MWLRDSAAQVMHYVRFVKEDGQLQEILEGVIARQAELVCTDPYANAFNEKPDGSGHKDDTKENPFVFERKYEADSLCAPIYLAYHYWKTTGKDTIFTQVFYHMLEVTAETFEKEQDHSRSDYYFRRDTDREIDTLTCDGQGSPVGVTGMPYLGYCGKDDELYQNTRSFILSADNPYYATGSAAKGVGSPHTGRGSVWHMGIIMQAMTSVSRDEIMECLKMLSQTHGRNILHARILSAGRSIRVYPFLVCMGKQPVCRTADTADGRGVF